MDPGFFSSCREPLRRSLLDSCSALLANHSQEAKTICHRSGPLCLRIYLLESFLRIGFALFRAEPERKNPAADLALGRFPDCSLFGARCWNRRSRAQGDIYCSLSHFLIIADATSSQPFSASGPAIFVAAT